MKPFRLVQISDLHLSASDIRHRDNWEMTLEWLEACPPDLIVVSGDVVLYDCDAEADLDFAAAQLSRLPARWRILPGNHDIGDNVRSGSGKIVTEARRQRWVDRFGSDHWVEETQDWTFIGLNGQILASRYESEFKQAEWLRQTLDALPAGRQIALFIHKPLFVDFPSETEFLASCVDPVGRSFLLDAFRNHSLRLIACGHKHQYRSFFLDGIYHVWSPAVSCVNHGPGVQMWGLREVGFIEYAFRPTDFRQKLVGRDFLFRHESYVAKMESKAGAERWLRA